MSNLTAQYISHSELQGFRAIRRGNWAKNIARVVEEEIAPRLSQPANDRIHSNKWQGAVEGREGTKLVAFALVTLSREAAVPYGVIEDVVVDKRMRGSGLGTHIIQWIIDDLRSVGIRRLFLESGVNNEKAHALFEHLGFEPLSIVMMREL